MAEKTAPTKTAPPRDVLTAARSGALRLRPLRDPPRGLRYASIRGRNGPHPPPGEPRAGSLPAAPECVDPGGDPGGILGIPFAEGSCEKGADRPEGHRADRPVAGQGHPAGYPEEPGLAHFLTVATSTPSFPAIHLQLRPSRLHSRARARLWW
jgi:hypothetical protein